jgi:putative ABC transport system permease protein
MGRLRAWAWRVAGLFNGGRTDGDLAEEIEAHLRMHAEDYERAGVTPDQARRQAVIAFGGVERVKEQYRDRRSVPIVDTILQDVRYALRSFRKNPGFTAAVLIVLALGIGANAAIFTIVNAVLLKPLPYHDPERLVIVWHVPPPASFPGMTRFAVSAANYLDWQRRQHVFQRMAIHHFRTLTLTGHGQPEMLRAQAVSAGFFEVLGVKPLEGRWFLPEEDQPGRGHVVILSHRLWQSRFGGDRSIVGKVVTLDGIPYTVVGIMDATFTLPEWAQVWTPLGWTEKERAVRGEHSCLVVARLAPGVDTPQAQAEMSAISRALEQEYPEDDKGWGAVVVPLRQDLVGDSRTSLLVLLGAVGFVLLIACANVANLVLARTLARRREMAVRLALGAGASRIVRQVLTETTLLAIGGGALGILVARAGVDVITAVFGEALPQWVQIHLDVRVLAFTALVSLLTGLAAGVAPALRLARSSVVDAIKQGGGRSDSEAGGSRVRSTLVVVEVALSLVLLIGAGLMIRSLWLLNSVDPGFDARHVLTGRMSLPESRYPKPDAPLRFFDTLLARVRALPGVESAAIATVLPLGGDGNSWPIAIVGRPQVPMAEQPQVQGDVITPGYLHTMRIPLVRGRDFTDADRAGAPAVVLVSEAMARRLWPGEDPIGQRLTIAFFPDAVREVVGVVKDVKERELTAAGTASMYLPLAQLLAQFPVSMGSIVVRTRTDLPEVLAPSLTAAVHAIDPDQPLVDVMPMQMVVARSMTDRRTTMYLLAAFAGFALVLAAIGLYSVLAYGVRRRVREIGIRMALGADGRGVVRMVMADALRPTLVGIVVGLLAAIAIRRVVASLLFGVSPGDPLTFAAVSALLVGVALASSALPAYAATRVDPNLALRDD